MERRLKQGGGLLALNRHTRRQEKMLIRTLADWNVPPPYLKRKRQTPDYAEAYAGRLSDDGELVDWDEGEGSQNDRQRKRSG